MPDNHVMETYKRYNITLVEGKGTKVYDIDGKEYIDFVSGVAVNCLGHCSPVITDALNKQSHKLIHVSNYFWNENNMKLADILCSQSDHNRVFFCNSGAEAVEGALKTAKKYGSKAKDSSKSKIIYMNNSFHGRTIGSLSVTGQPKYQQDFLPLLPNVKNIDFNDIDALEKNFDEDVCGVILEPIQGEGGINTATKEFLQKARELCDKFDALLIFDEVQCGMGRLGTLFAYKSFDVVPDVVCIAKALGGGFPIGAFLTNERATSLTYGDHGSTYGGNPLACAVAIAILKELTDRGIISEIPKKSQYLIKKLEYLKEKYGYITEIKGMGLLIGIKIKGSTSDFVQKCIENGLLLITANNDVIRLLPPLNVSESEIDIAINILEKVISNINNN